MSVIREIFEGDLCGTIGSVKLGEKRLGKLFAEFGGETVTVAKERILDAAERQARAVIETWQDGIYHGEALLTMTAMKCRYRHSRDSDGEGQ